MEALCNLLQRWLNPWSIINSLFKFPTINYSSEYKTNLKKNETREGKIQLCNYLTAHSSITPRVRASLVHLIVEVHQKLRLSPETLYLTVSIFDRFLSKETVPVEDAKLVGVCAMLIASKYGVYYDPLLKLQELTDIWMPMYTIRDILRMKERILKRLESSLNVPTPHTYLFRYINIERTDHETECMIYFFSELALMQHSLIKMCPSLIAASCVHAARCTLKKYPLWTEALQGGTKYSEPQLLECTEILVEAHSQAPKSILNAVYKKYSLDKFKKVALHAPPPGSSTSRTAEPTRVI
ncbi:Cyclin family protein [Rhynchospora pubera]|uniref:Cyclin family protein n=1 Tax=Rhynchospora pubera TaxID=906938 RepID=A0AAV8FJ69_9POAL|nr:Cyclin family protein [Rhynchospora pubera]